MRFMKIEAGFATNHSNPISVSYYVLIKGRIDTTLLGSIKEHEESCSSCGNREECTPPEADMRILEGGCLRLKKEEYDHCNLCWNQETCEDHEYREGCEFKIVCSECDEYRNCVENIIDEDTKEKLKTGGYILVEIDSGMDTFECECRGTMDGLARTGLKKLLIKYPTSEIIRSIGKYDSGISDEAISDLDDWLKGRIIVHYYILIAGLLSSKNLLFPVGDLLENCILITELDLGRHPELKKRLTTEELGKIEERKYSVVDVCGHCFAKSVHLVGRAKKYADEGLMRLKKENSIIKILGSSVLEPSYHWAFSESELPQL